MTLRARLTLLRIAALVGLCAAVAMVQSWIFLAAVAGILLVLALVLRLSRGVLRLLGMATLFGLPMVFLIFFLAGREATGSWRAAPLWGLASMVPYSLRMGDLVLADLVFIRLTSLVEIMEALKALHLPDPFVLFMSTVIRFIPRIIQETRRVVDAQRCRGLTPRRMFRPSGLLGIFVPLFLGQIQRSRDLALSLEIRNASFSGRPRSAGDQHAL
ncbi:MAG TPA: energy-coupling factor transporter transmembrane component T [Holophaga sp.]|nr:energy-coupling factor transporter transmembrane component T [Holophaga sp.]